LYRDEPRLAPGLGFAYRLPEMAQVRNPWYLRALLAAAATLGVQMRAGCPSFGFVREKTRIVAVETGEGRLSAGQYLVCTGAWTDALLAPLGCRLEVSPVRGQIVLLRLKAPIVRRIVLRGKRYLVPRPDGRLLVGSTEEHAGFDKTTTAAAVGELIRFAVELVPALASATVERCWAGLRPGSRDGLPSVGRVPGFDNLWVAAGHFRAGIQLSAATGLVLAEAMTGKVPTVPLEPFAPGRPAAPPVRPTFRS
jgi:glycine oxidase